MMGAMYGDSKELQECVSRPHRNRLPLTHCRSLAAELAHHRSACRARSLPLLLLLPTRLSSTVHPHGRLARSEGLDMRDPECSAAPMVRMLTMIRNRDMLMGYLRHRMERIEEARWDVAGNLPSEALELLSPNEREYDREYAGLLAEFQAEYDDFDLTLNATPPTDLYIKVLVKHEVGSAPDRVCLQGASPRALITAAHPCALARELVHTLSHALACPPAPSAHARP